MLPLFQTDVCVCGLSCSGCAWLQCTVWVQYRSALWSPTHTKCMPNQFNKFVDTNIIVYTCTCTFVRIICVLITPLLQVIIQSFNQSFNHTKFTSFEMNVSESVFALGGLLGALPAGLMADGLGR